MINVTLIVRVNSSNVLFQQEQQHLKMFKTRFAQLTLLHVICSGAATILYTSQRRGRFDTLKYQSPYATCVQPEAANLAFSIPLKLNVGIRQFETVIHRRCKRLVTVPKMSQNEVLTFHYNLIMCE
jgi:hypothetical protein